MKIRIYYKEKLQTGATILALKEQTHYLKNVLRLENGKEIFVFNEIEGEFLGKVIFEGKSVSIKLIEMVKQPKKPKIQVSLAFSLIKNAGISEMLDKCTQIGISNFYPLITQHSSNHHFSKERAEKIIIEACEQSERIIIPTISEVLTLEKFIQTFANKKIIFCDEKASIEHNILNQEACEDLIILIGPEGGFSQSERETLLKLPTLTRVSLGNGILRAETAGICASFLLNLKLL